MVSLKIFLLSALPLLAEAGCYTSGAHWNDRGNADYHINRACNGWWENGFPIKGAFERTWFKSYTESPYPYNICVNGINGQRYDFSVTNRDPEFGAELSPTLCYEMMKNEIWGCGQGGENGYEWWSFRADPNDGYC